VKKFDDIIGHVVRQSLKKIFFKQNPSKYKNNPEIAEQIKAKLYRYDCPSMRNKKFSTFDVICRYSYV